MKNKSESLFSKQNEIRDLQKQLISIREENTKLKNALNNGDNNMITKVILRKKVFSIMNSIGNFFTFNSKKIAMLSKEIESLRKENIAQFEEIESLNKKSTRVFTSCH